MNRRGVTLVEMLVAMGFVALLTAILIVSLRGVRTQATDLQNLAHMKFSLVDFSSWSADHEGLLLNAGLPQNYSAQWYYMGEPDIVLRQNMYLAQSLQWPRVLHHWLGSYREHWHPTQGANDLNGELDVNAMNADGNAHWLPTHFIYSATLRAAPESWTFPGRGWSLGEYAERFKAVHFDGVQTPSTKGALTYRPQAASQERFVGFLDGSVDSYEDKELSLPGANPQAIPTDIRGTPVFDTLDGCRGADR